MDKNSVYKGVADCINSDPQMKSCFDSLPQMVRESILMSGVEINSVEQLRSIADKLMSKGE